MNRIKWISALLALALLIGGCGQQAVSTPETSSLVSSVAASSSSVSTEPVSSESSSSSIEIQIDAKLNGFVNPAQTYDTIFDLQNAVGFAVLSFPKRDLTSSTYSVIDNMAQIDAYSIDGNEICIRQAFVSEDISGVFGATYKKAQIGNTEVNLATTSENLSVAWWMNAGYSYSFTIQNADWNDFKSRVETLVYIADKNIEQGVFSRESFADVAELNKALGFSVLDLPAVFKLQPQEILLENTTGKGYLRYVDQSHPDYTVYISLYTGLGTENTCVLKNELNYQKTEINGVSVQMANDLELMGEIYSVWWTDGIYNYEATSLGQTRDEFMTMMEYLLNMTKA